MLSDCFSSWISWEKQLGPLTCPNVNITSGCKGGRLGNFLLPKILKLRNMGNNWRDILLNSWFSQAMLFGSILNSINLKCLSYVKYKLATSKNKVCSLLFRVPHEVKVSCWIPRRVNKSQREVQKWWNYTGTTITEASWKPWKEWDWNLCVLIIDISRPFWVSLKWKTILKGRCCTCENLLNFK